MKHKQDRFNIEKLASLVRSKRGTRGLRETAKEIGNVSPSTISRVENGKTPDMDTFLALCNWLEVPPAELMKNTQDETDLNTPEAIEIQLRADKNLEPAIANALASLVKAAYKDLSQQQNADINSNKDKNTMLSKPEYTLKELLAGASSEDFEGEYDWGELGEKIW